MKTIKSYADVPMEEKEYRLTLAALPDGCPVDLSDGHTYWLVALRYIVPDEQGIGRITKMGRQMLALWIMVNWIDPDFFREKSE